MADLVLDWSLLGAYGTSLGPTTSVDTGGVAVQIDFTEQDAGAQAFTFNADGHVGAGEPFDPNSHLKLFGEGGDGGAVSATSSTTLSFSSISSAYTSQVQNVSFRLNDIDGGAGEDITGGPGGSFEDNITILAYDAAGNAVPVTLTPGADVTQTGATLTGDELNEFTSPDASVLVSIPGPVARIDVIYANGGDSAQGALISDVHFSTVDTEGGDNLPPVAVDDDLTVPFDEDLVVDPLANDSDPDSDPISITSIGTPSSGTLTPNGDGTYTYTPVDGFVGDVTIPYTIDDPAGLTDSATITIAVTEPSDNPVPDAMDDAGATTSGVAVTVDFLGNDLNPEGGTLTVTAMDTPANGTLVDNGDGTVTYTPDADFVGVETVDYTVSDPSGDSDTATITFTVTAPDGDNTPPVAVDDVVSTDPGVAVDFFPLANDTDVDPDDEIVLDSITAPTGTGEVVVGADGLVTFTPAAGVTGPVVLDYQISDGSGGTDTGTVTVNVGDVANTPPVAMDDTATTPEGTAVEIFPLANDTDADGDPLTITSATSPNGTVTINPATATTPQSVTFTPTDGFTGPATITYVIDDGNGGGDTGSIAVSVTDPTGGPDGYVDGTPGDDVIFTNSPTDRYEGDPNGDFVDSGDALLPGEAPEDDIIRAGAGDDTITSGLGDDEVLAGEGDDVVDSGVGDDSVIGEGGEDDITTGDGSDTVRGGDDDDTIDTSGSSGAIDTDVFPVTAAQQPLDPLDGLDEDADPENDRDFVEGGLGNDTITTGDDRDTIEAGDGDDVVDSGIDDDLVLLGEGNDSLTDVQGSDTVFGGSGDDTINVGTNTYSDYVGDPLLAPLGTFGFTSDPNQTDGLDFVDAGAGNDVVTTGDDDDTVLGGSGDDTIDVGIDDDSVQGNLGNDSILGGHGSDTLDGGGGNDYIDGSAPASFEELDATDPVPTNDRDQIQGGQGDDTLIGGDDDDTLDGGQGNDSLDGGIDDDVITGNQGDDTIIGGQGADTLSGGADRDLFIGADAGDQIDGGSAPTGVRADGIANDYDTLDLSGLTPGTFQITYTSADREDGFIEFLDGAGTVTGRADFVEIENIVPCFTPGTRIATPIGERLVEDLREGDRIITRDNGIQEIRWMGQKNLTGHELARAPHLRPILIQAGSLGNGLPEHDMLVSPNHRVLVNNDKTALYFEEREVLAAAKHLTGIEGVDEVGTLGVSYIHFMFDQHEVVLSNGAWTESFQPGDYTLQGIGNAQRTEILELFPELKTQEGLKDYQSARRSLKKHEAQLLAK